MPRPTETIDSPIDVATKAHEKATRDIEMAPETLTWLLLTHCIHEKELDAVAKIMEHEKLNATERGWMTLYKLKLFKDVLYGVEDDYQISAKYYLFYCASNGLFRWIEGRRLMGLLRHRSPDHLRQANKQQLDVLVTTMIEDLKELRPPALRECTARLAVPGRHCREIAEVVAVSNQTVSNVLAEVADSNKHLAECWEFWREERAEWS